MLGDLRMIDVSIDDQQVTQPERPDMPTLEDDVQETPIPDIPPVPQGQAPPTQMEAPKPTRSAKDFLGGAPRIITPEIESQTEYLKMMELQQAADQSRKENIALKNQTPIEAYTPQEAGEDMAMTGDSVQVSTLNKLINGMDKFKRREYEQKSYGKPINERIDIANQVYRGGISGEGKFNMDAFLDRSNLEAKVFVESGAKSIAQQVGGVVPGVLEMGADLTPGLKEETRQKIKQSARKYQSELDELTSGSLAEYGIHKGSDVSKMLGGTIGSLMTSTGTFLIGGAPLTAGVFFSNYLSEHYPKMRDSGMGKTKSTIATLSGATLNAILETWGAQQILTKVPGKGKIVQLVKNMITEGSEEAAQQLLAENAIAKMTYDKKRKLTEGVLQSTLLGMFGGGVFGAVMPARIESQLDKAGVPQKDRAEFMKAVEKKAQELYQDPEMKKNIRKMATEARQELIDKGVDPELASEIEGQIKQGTISQPEVEEAQRLAREEGTPGETLRAEPGEEGKYQEAKDLYALHNISPEKLEASYKLGGLPVPSVAITKKGVPFEGFGDITLVGNQELIDPKKQDVKVFDSDVYSSRVPKPTYDRDVKKIHDVMEDLAPSFKETGDYQYAVEQILELERPETALGRLKETKGMQYDFLKSKGEDIEIPKEVVPVDDLFMNDTFTNYASKEWDGESADYDQVEKRQEIGRAVKSSIDDYINRVYEADPEIRDLAEESRQEIYDQYLEEDGSVIFGKLMEVENNLRKASNPELVIDNSKLRDELEKRIKKYSDEEYEQYIENKTKDVYSEGYLKRGRAKEEYNLENLVDAVLRGGVRGVENTLVNGLGKARSKGAQELRDITAIRNKKYDLVTYEEMERVKEELNDRLFNIGNKFENNYAYDNRFDMLDDLSQSVADYIKGSRKRLSVPKMERALRNNNFTGELDTNYVEALAQLGHDLMKSPTQYFEAKIKRAVKLNEFKGAVVPKGISDKYRQILKSAGVETIHEYDPNVPGDRTRVIDEKFKSQRFQKATGEVKKEPFRRLVEIGKAREILMPYGVDPRTVRGEYEIKKPDGTPVRGMYYEGLTHIAMIANKNTGYHEAFHQVVDKFADQKLYDRASAEVSRETGFEDDLEIEEHLAERFADYMNTRKEKSKGIKGFFNNLLGKMKSVLGVDSKTRNLFDSIVKPKTRVQVRKSALKRFQAMSDNELRRERNRILEDELNIMKNEIRESEAGRREFIPSMERGETQTVTGVKSTFPQWFRDGGFTTKKEAMTAFKKGNKNYPKMVDIARDRLERGYTDPLMGALPPNEDWIRTSLALGEEVKAIEKEETGEAEIERREAIKEKREKVKKMLPEKAFAEGKAEAKKEVRAEKKEKVEEVKKMEGEKRRDLFNRLRTKRMNVEEYKKEAIKYANQVIDPEQRGKLLSAINNIKTERGKMEVMNRIRDMEDQIYAKQEVKKLEKTIKKLDLKRMRPEYRDKIQVLIDELQMTKPSSRKLKELISMREFVESNPDHNIPEESLRELSRLDDIPIRDLVTDDVIRIRHAIEHLEHLNKLKNKMITKQREREQAKTVDEVVRNVKRKKGIDRDENNIDVRFEHKGSKKGVLKYMGDALTIKSYNGELLAEILDKQENGIIKEVLYDDIDAGRTEELRMKQEAHDYFENKLKGIENIKRYSKSFVKPKNYKKGVDYVTTKLPSGKQITLTRGERIALYLHSLNSNNWAHITEGGFSLASDRSRIVKLSLTDLQTVLDTITDSEVKVADAMYEYFNVMQKEKLNETSVMLNGFEVATVEDYFPIKTSEFDRYAKFKELMPADMKTFIQQTLEGMGMFKERTNAKNALMLEDAFVTTMESINNASAYHGLAAPLRNAKLLLNDASFRRAIVDSYGESYLKTLQNYIRDIEVSSANKQDIDKVITDFSGKITIGVLGANPWVMLKQPVSYILSSTEIPSQYVYSKVPNLAKNLVKPSQDTVDKIRKYSPQLRERSEGKIDRDLGELSSAGQTRTFFTNSQNFEDMVMGGIGKFDMGAVTTIWEACEAWVKNETDLKGDELYREVAKRTEQAVRRTQPTFDVKDRSEIGRNKQMYVKLLTKFSSQRNKNVMIMRRAVERWNLSKKTPRDFLKAFNAFNSVLFLSPLLLLGINRLRDFLYGRNNEEEDAGWLNKFTTGLVDIVEMNMSNIYFVGNAYSVIRKQVEQKLFKKYTPWGTSIEDPLTGSVNDLLEAFVEVGKASKDLITQEKYNRTIKKYGIKRGQAKWLRTMPRSLERLFSQVALFKGIPYRNIKGFVYKVPKKQFYDRIKGELDKGNVKLNKRYDRW